MWFLKLDRLEDIASLAFDKGKSSGPPGQETKEPLRPRPLRQEPNPLSPCKMTAPPHLTRMDEAKPLSSRKLQKAGIPGARKHLFFCLGPDCCQKKKGQALWSFAKKRIAELELPVMRTKAGCFRICSEGPWLVVYPDGVWYSNVTPERLERILEEHVAGGKPVSEWVAAVNPLETI